MQQALDMILRLSFKIAERVIAASKLEDSERKTGIINGFEGCLCQLKQEYDLLKSYEFKTKEQSQ